MTTTTSANDEATCPNSGRLERSRSPPAPKTTMTRPPSWRPRAGAAERGEAARSASSRAAFSASARAAGVWAKSTRTAKGWPSSTVSNRPRTGGTSAKPVATASQLAPISRAVVAAAMALTTLKRPPRLSSRRSPRHVKEALRKPRTSSLASSGRRSPAGRGLPLPVGPIWPPRDRTG